MNRQQKIAFFIGIVALVILDACYIRTSLGEDYLFDNSLNFYELFKNDYFYHFGLLLVFFSFILLMNGNKGYEKINENLEEILRRIG